MGRGQQVVAFGIHPDTSSPYHWPGHSPLDTRFEDLPVVTEAAVRAFLAAAEAAIRKAGGHTKKELGAAAKAQRAPPPPRHTNGAGNGVPFFKQVNAAALGDLRAWVPQLFGDKAKLQATGAYRVSSTDLGRDYEEDLSIHPDGIQDFGPEVAMSPVDVVMQFAGAAKIQDAALTLCGWLGRDPHDSVGSISPRSRTAQNLHHRNSSRRQPSPPIRMLSGAQ